MKRFYPFKNANNKTVCDAKEYKPEYKENWKVNRDFK
jgi:hypothetical protein